MDVSRPPAASKECGRRRKRIRRHPARHDDADDGRLETLAALRSHPATAATPVIFLTAKARGTEVERMRALGAAGVLIKPFNPRTLSGGRARPRRTAVVAMLPPRCPAKPFKEGLDKIRERFAATFVAAIPSAASFMKWRRCIHEAPSPRSRTSPIDWPVAGAIGFPTIGALVLSHLENLVAGASGGGGFDESAARDACGGDPKRFRQGSGQAGDQDHRPGVADRSDDPSLIVDDHTMVRRGLRAPADECFRGSAFG